MGQKNPMYSKSLSLFFVATLLRKDLHSRSDAAGIPACRFFPFNPYLKRQNPPPACSGKESHRPVAVCAFSSAEPALSLLIWIIPKRQAMMGIASTESPPIALDKDQETC